MKNPLALGIVVVALAACSTVAVEHAGPPTRPQGFTKHRATSPRIQHVVIIIQENRTVDNLFNGYPGANTVSTWTQKGVPVTLQPVALDYPCDIGHGHDDWSTAWDNGAMDNFDGEKPLSCPTSKPANYPYSYVPQNQTVPYWDIAKKYYFNDNTFEDPTTPSFPSHQYYIAGQAGTAMGNPHGGTTGMPWGCDYPSGMVVTLFNGTMTPPCGPTFDYQTLGDLLDHHSPALTWNFYAPKITGPGACQNEGCIWSAYDAVSHIRNGPDWANVLSPPNQIVTNMNSGATLPAVTWVVPNSELSDHASLTTKFGPDWVANVVNAIGASNNWNSTLIFIVWDDWGGWFDHATPSPNGAQTVGGFRVPLLCISPFTNANSLSHLHYEGDSILAFIEQNFGTGTLGQQDSVDPPVADCMNSIVGQPQAFRPIATPSPGNYNHVLHHPSKRAPDDN